MREFEHFYAFSVMSLKMKFHKHLAGNMYQLPELYPNRMHNGQNNMVSNTHTRAHAHTHTRTHRGGCNESIRTVSLSEDDAGTVGHM